MLNSCTTQLLNHTFFFDVHPFMHLRPSTVLSALPIKADKNSKSIQYQPSTH